MCCCNCIAYCLSGEYAVAKTQYGSDVVDPTYSSEEDAPSVQYHPQAIIALKQLKAGLEKLLKDTNAAIVADPPPYVPVAAAPATIKNATVRNDAADVYDTPHEGARVLGKIDQGAILPLALDPSRDGSATWYRITSGQYRGHFVKGADLNVQTD
jgi:hypothetical protein